MADPSDSLDNLSLEDRLKPIAHAYQADMTALLVQRDSINKLIASLRAQAREDGLPHLKLLDARIKLQTKLTPAEQADLARADAMYASFLKMPLGTQQDAFGDPRVPDAAQNILGWAAMGHQDGLAGRGWANELPAGLPEEARKPYGDAWEAGQKERQESYAEIARRKEAPPAAKGAKRTRKKKDEPALELADAPSEEVFGDSVQSLFDDPAPSSDPFGDQVRELAEAEEA